MPGLSVPMQVNKETINRNSKISNQKHIVEEIGENGEVQYYCAACRRTFRSRSQRYYHINCTQLQNLAYKCEHCDLSFARQTQLKYHTESHISPVNECQTCQKIFSNPLALKKHTSLHREELKLCPHCDKTFKKKTSLEQHIAAQHLNILQYGCAYCSKKYSSKSTLQLHLQSHEKKRFECTFCGKLFQRNSILNLHLKRHFNANSYICTVCQKVFSESGALARHRKIHEENVSQYYCKLCDKSILRKDNMTRHLTTIHPEEKFDNIVKIIKPSIIPKKVESTVESKKCDLYISTQEKNITKSDKKCVIIENKLLYKPAENGSFNDLPKKNLSNSVKYPLINQIKVITAGPTHKKEIDISNIDNTSQEMIQHNLKANHQQQEDSILSINQEDSYAKSIQIDTNYDFIHMENQVIEKGDSNAGNIAFVNQSHLKKFNQTGPEITVPETANNLEYFHTNKNKLETFNTADADEHHSVKNYESAITRTFSSVIRSVGNVKKPLTSHNITRTGSINQTSSEYKHKKYSHSNYNIELYRKILGCNENDDDEDGDGDLEKQKEIYHMPKSSTPVHWRKYFKNNYETSAS